MKRYATEHIRNVALIGHSASGKTSLSEALLHAAGAIERAGKVDAGNTHSDYDPEEVKRKVSISASLLPLENKDTKVNLIDCPGYRDFVGEIKNGVRAAETALIVVDATTGVEVGTEFAWSYAEECAIPRAFFVNKMDKERADFQAAIRSIEATFEDAHCIPVTLPIGSEDSFKGVIDLLRMKAVYDENGTVKEEDIPADLLDQAQEARMALVEAAAEGDDELTEKYLLEESLTDEEIIRGLREDLQSGRFAPVLCGSAEKETGINVLLHFIQAECPSPNQRPGFLGYKNGREGETEYKPIDPKKPFSAYIFKTVNDEYVGRLSFFKVITGNAIADAAVKNAKTGQSERVGHLFSFRGKSQISVDGLAAGDIGAYAKLEGVSTGDTVLDPKAPEVIYEPTPLPSPSTHMAIEAKSKSDEDKMGMGLHKILECDPTLKVERDPMLHQTVLSGMGDTHLEVAASKLLSAAKVEILMHPPKVQYRETISKTGEGQGKFKKQTGGRGQYGDCWVRLSPLPRGTGFTFEWKIVGGVIPTNFQSSVEKGLRESLNNGILAGYPVVDVAAECYDGSYHAVDSSDTAFQVAASMAFKNVAPKCGPALLEPINSVMIEVPADYMGDIMGYVSGKRGRISGNEQLGNKVRVTAEVPAAEMGTFGRDLRSMTQGRSVFEAEFDHYEPVPPAILDKVIEEVRIDHKDDE